MKKCPKCNEYKEKSEFNVNLKKKDGLQTYCRDCQKGIDRDSYRNRPERAKEIRDAARARRDRIIASRNEHLRNGCVLCEEKEICALDLHHTDPSSKDFAVSYAIRRGLSHESVLREIKKCVVLCANCHRKVHAGIIAL